MSNQPTTAYKRHHEVEAPQVDSTAFRQGWRVRTRLEQLRDTNRITAGELQAALDYRATCERVQQASFGSSGLTPRVSSSTVNLDRLAAVVDLVEQLRELEARIGRTAFTLCFASVVTDSSWADLGRRMGCHPETARDRTVVALKQLARAWAKAPGRSTSWDLTE